MDHQFDVPSPNGEDELYAFPLSPAQLRIWRSDQMRPGNPAFNGSFRLNLVGPLNVDIFRKTFNEIVRRHEALRTRIGCVNSTPLQLISPSLDLQIAVRDLRNIPEPLREDEMDRICAEEARRSFSLKYGPLIHVGLIQMLDERNVVTLTVHHIVSDGWSISVIMEELQQIYAAIAIGRESPLAKLAIQFGDYVVWQKERVADGSLVHQLSYWKDKLHGCRPLRVPTDFPRPAERTTNSKIVSELLAPDVAAGLKTLGTKLGGTMFTTTLAACMLLLHRYTNETDIAIGSTLAGRDRPDTENLVGIFINQIVLRTKVIGDPSFSVFAILVRDIVWEALANQEIPFEEVTNALGSDTEIEGEFFHSINFICQREYARASTFVFEFAGLRMSTMPSKSQGALYDLNFFMVERELGWRLSLEYNIDLYKDTTAVHLLMSFRDLLVQIADNPDLKLSEFILVPSHDASFH